MRRVVVVAAAATPAAVVVVVLLLLLLLVVVAWQQCGWHIKSRVQHQVHTGLLHQVPRGARTVQGEWHRTVPPRPW
jgi:hypothetical protein